MIPHQDTESSSGPLSLFNYFRSSAAYRVRIALHLKGLSYDYVPVHLTQDGGRQFQEPYRSMNPQRLVPLLDDKGFRLSQSLAIIEYLDERYPDQPLLPQTSEARARTRQIALSIACDIHPLQNLRVLKYLTGELGLSEENKLAWVQHWIRLGLEAMEEDLSRSSFTGRFCVGDTPTMADCVLVPQLFSAARFGVDTSSWTTLQSINAACEALPAFANAHPGKQIDSE
jgi:maleylpyruvate isomerase